MPDARTQAWLDQEDERVAQSIRSHGVAIEYVIGDPEARQTPIAYTIGLFGLGHPELLVTGADPHQGVPLNVGRRYRSVTPAIWMALVARDTGCQWAGCTAPAAYCEAHHLPHRIQGSQTSLEDTGLYCSHHHTVIHAQGWKTELGPDGRPQLRPPAWIDPERTPIRNTYWQRQEELRLDLVRGREPDDD